MIASSIANSALVVNPSGKFHGKCQIIRFGIKVEYVATGHAIRTGANHLPPPFVQKFVFGPGNHRIKRPKRFGYVDTVPKTVGVSNFKTKSLRPLGQRSFHMQPPLIRRWVYSSIYNCQQCWQHNCCQVILIG